MLMSALQPLWSVTYSSELLQINCPPDRLTVASEWKEKNVVLEDVTFPPVWVKTAPPSTLPLFISPIFNCLLKLTMALSLTVIEPFLSNAQSLATVRVALSLTVIAALSSSFKVLLTVNLELSLRLNLGVK